LNLRLEQHRTMTPKIHPKLVAWTIAVAASLGVFSLYVHPDFMVMLANQVWACF
jgi:hypothetical protein